MPPFWDAVSAVNSSICLYFLLLGILCYLMTAVSFYAFSILIPSSPELANDRSHKLLDYKGTSHNSKVINEFKLMKNRACRISALISFPFFVACLIFKMDLSSFCHYD